MSITQKILRPTHYGLAAAIATILAATAQPAGAAIPIADVPLFAATAVKPNVMLLIDNSFSMQNIIWHEDFAANPNGDYGHRYVPDGSNEYDEFNDDGDGLHQECVANERCLLLPIPREPTAYDTRYLQFLFDTFGKDDQTVDLSVEIPGITRIKVAQNVAAEFVADNFTADTSKLRLGLAKFNGREGGRVVAACGATKKTLQDEVDLLGDAFASTPLAEAYYEVTRYFRGLDAYYPNDTTDSFSSPVEYRCQKNFVIVITDGLPTYDDNFPSAADDPDIPSPEGQTLPDWDGIGAGYPPGERFSDGNGGDLSKIQSALFLDDLAKFGYELDLKTTGTDEEGGSFENTGGESFDPQNLLTYTVGFSIANQMLEDAAYYGHGEYFTAFNADQLTAALQKTLASIADKVSTAAALSATSSQASTNTTIFRATFNTDNWTGDLQAFGFNAIGTGDPQWTAAGQIPAPASRDIYTADDRGDGIAFQWDSLDAGAQGSVESALSNLDFLSDPPAVSAADLAAYIRGSDANEQAAGGPFRSRDSLLGDIIHSTPAFAGDQGYGYAVLPGEGGVAYSTYVASKADEPDIVLVGANDAMLHAFDAETGAERFAYLPRQLLDDLEHLADPAYVEGGHRYYVDGSPAVADAYLNGAWHTVVVTTLGRGGKGVFALDITDPDNFDQTDVLWELSPQTAAPEQGSVDVGQYFGEAMGSAAIVRTESGRWVAILGNGYNSAADSAALIVVALATGEVLAVLDTGTGGDNGLGPPAAIDRDRNGSVDTVYAGDLQGNLWKFDLSGDAEADWAVAYGGTPLVTALDDAGSAQPITARPDAIAHPRGGVLVVFGTGKYLGTGDVTDTSEQSIYGIWDRAGVVDDNREAPVGAMTDLVAQEFIATDVATKVGQRSVRVISDKTVDYTSKRGWVLDMSRLGERVVRGVRIFDGKVILVSSIPNNEDLCLAGGDSALYEINPLTGSQFERPILDLDEDGAFDSGDGVTVTVNGEETLAYPGVVDVNVGLATNPYIFNEEGGNDQSKLITGSSLGTERVGERGFMRPGPASWVQIR